VQVVGAGVTGALTVLLGLQLVVVTVFYGGLGFTMLVALGMLCAGIGLLVLVASIAPGEFWFTRTRGGRFGWAILVGGLGAAGLSLTWRISEEAGLDLDDHLLLWVGLSGAPFALAAGLLLRRWYLAAGSLVLSVAATAGLLNALAATVPEPTEVNFRAAAAGRDRGDFFVTQVPGYHIGWQSGRFQLDPDDPAIIPLARDITLYTSLDDPTPDCAFNPRDPELQGHTCIVERPGLTYTKAVDAHGYFLRAGTTLIEIVGSPAVDQNLLRDAVLRAVPGPDPAIYTVDIPGYTSMKAGPRPGISFQQADKTQLPYARHVEIEVTRYPSAGQCAVFPDSQYLECVDEHPGLAYWRLTDKQMYVSQRGPVEVRVIGGLGVDRNLLRDAALASRPATDDELLTMLPPAPDRPTTFMDSVKSFAKWVFG
jgi:hypothetical protein